MGRRPRALRFGVRTEERRLFRGHLVGPSGARGSGDRPTPCSARASSPADHELIVVTPSHMLEPVHHARDDDGTLLALELARRAARRDRRRAARGRALPADLRRDRTVASPTRRSKSPRPRSRSRFSTSSTSSSPATAPCPSVRSPRTRRSELRRLPRLPDRAHALLVRQRARVRAGRRHVVGLRQHRRRAPSRRRPGVVRVVNFRNRLGMGGLQGRR